MAIDNTLTKVRTYMQKLAVGDRIPSATVLTSFTELDHLLPTVNVSLFYRQVGGGLA